MAFGRKKATGDEDGPALASELAVLRSVLVNYPAGTLLHFGSPSRCPDCGDYGMVERTSQATGICVNHCRVCRRDWILTLRALRAYRNDPGAAVVPTDWSGPPERSDPTAGPSRPSQPGRPGRSGPSGALWDPHDAPAPRFSRQPVTAEPVVAAVEGAGPPPDDQVRHLAATHVERDPVAPARVPDPAPSHLDLATGVDRLLAADPSGMSAIVDLSDSGGPLRVLVVDDNPFDLGVIEDLLEPFTVCFEVELTHFATRRQAEEAAASTRFDVVLLALELPDSFGLSTVLEWQLHVPDFVPLIALVDGPNADLVQEARALGVISVIQKAHLEKLSTQGEKGQQRMLKLLRTTARDASTVSAERSGPTQA